MSDLYGALASIETACKMLDASYLRRFLRHHELQKNAAARAYVDPMLQAAIEFCDKIEAHKKLATEALAKVQSR